MPIGPGTRIRNAILKDLGTLGCILRPLDRNDPNRYLLSAAHVLNPGGYGAAGDLIEAEVSPGNWQVVAELTDWTPINGLSSEGIKIDAAVARLRPEFATDWQSVGQAIAPRGVAAFRFPGMAVNVFGAQTAQLKSGTLHSDGGEVLVDYRVQMSGLPAFAMKVAGQIFYGEEQGGWRSVTTGGDSGALVTDRFDLAVGLHIGGTNANSGVDLSVCTPIQDILDRFEMDLDRGTEDGIAVAAGTVPPPAPSVEHVSAAAVQDLGIRILPLLTPHNYMGGVGWQLTPRGVMVAGKLPRTGGAPQTVGRVWSQYGEQICRAARVNQVPVELIVATICTESHGNPAARRVEPDGRVSVGLMQTLLGTARDVMRDQTIDEAWLREPGHSIEAGTACIANERRHSEFDPPLVAAIYNAGRLKPAYDNRWHFVQYVGSHTHADSFVEWFNDCFAMFEASPPALDPDVPAFRKLLKV